MQSAFETLSRIKWSITENPEDYSIFILDRIEKKLKEIRFESIKSFGRAFMCVEQKGEIVEIPLHRIREIRKNGKLVWGR